MSTPDIITLCETYALMPREAQEAVNVLSYHESQDRLFLGRYKRLRPIDQYAVTDWLELATAYGLAGADQLLGVAEAHNAQHPHPGRVAWYTLPLEELDAQRRSAS